MLVGNESHCGTSEAENTLSQPKNIFHNKSHEDKS